MKTNQPAVAGVCLSLLAALTGGVRAQAADLAVPGRSVGHVFLGMERADVWKILGRPKHTSSIPHGMDLYSEDEWASGVRALWVISAHDKVVQIEFNSPRLTTTDGLSTDSTLAQVRRRHPAMTVRSFGLKLTGEDSLRGFAMKTAGTDTIHGLDTTDTFYLDDVTEGVAFTFAPITDIGPEALNSPPDAIIIHRPGHQAVSIYAGRWSAPSQHPEGLKQMRAWFTPGRPRRGGNR